MATPPQYVTFHSAEFHAFQYLFCTYRRMLLFRGRNRTIRQIAHYKLNIYVCPVQTNDLKIYNSIDHLFFLKPDYDLYS